MILTPRFTDGIRFLCWNAVFARLQTHNASFQWLILVVWANHRPSSVLLPIVLTFLQHAQHWCSMLSWWWTHEYWTLQERPLVSYTLPWSPFRPPDYYTPSSWCDVCWSTMVLNVLRLYAICQKVNWWSPNSALLICIIICVPTLAQIKEHPL